MEIEIEVPELAVTLVQPMGTCIVRGWKPIENRKWPPWPQAIGKLVAIHAGAKWDPAYYRFAEPLVPDDELSRAALISCPRSAIIGVARVTGYVTTAALLGEVEARWFVGPFGWRLTHVVAFDPIPCPGSLGLWRVPEHARGVMRAQLERARAAVA